MQLRSCAARASDQPMIRLGSNQVAQHVSHETGPKAAGTGHSCFGTWLPNKQAAAATVRHTPLCILQHAVAAASRYRHTPPCMPALHHAATRHGLCVCCQLPTGRYCQPASPLRHTKVLDQQKVELCAVPPPLASRRIPRWYHMVIRPGTPASQAVRRNCQSGRPPRAALPTTAHDSTLWVMQILETKTRKLEQLVRLKDAKIQTLLLKLETAEGA